MCGRSAGGQGAALDLLFPLPGFAMGGWLAYLFDLRVRPSATVFALATSEIGRYAV